MIILHGCLVVFTGLHWFVFRVRSISLFVVFVGVFSITPFNVDMKGLPGEFESLEGIGDLRPILSS